MDDNDNIERVAGRHSAEGTAGPNFVLFVRNISLTAGIIPNDVGIGPDNLLDERSITTNDDGKN